MPRTPLALALLLSLSAPAFAAPDIEAGQRIARRWCASCHVVAPDQTSASADVPSFAAVAAKKYDTKTLTGFLAEPHPKMPSMGLSRDEISNLIGYIRTLGPPMPPDKIPEQDKPDTPKNG